MQCVHDEFLFLSFLVIQIFHIQGIIDYFYGTMGKRKDFHPQMKQAILNLRRYFENDRDRIRSLIHEKKLKKTQLPFDYRKVVQRTSAALNISSISVKRVSSEMKLNGSLLKSRKKNSGRHKIELDSFSEGVIRRTVLEFYCNKQYPTVAMLHSKLQEDPNFPRLSKSTLLKVMTRQLKFKFVRFQGKPVPLERDDISAQRFHYLRTVRRYRNEGYKIYFQDESWCNANQSPGSGWHIPEKEVLGMASNVSQIDIWLKGVGHRFADGLMGGISSKPSGAGKRVIMIDVGSDDGFLEGVGKVFIGTKNTGDYHSEMNSAHFLDWFAQVLEKLPSRSVVIVDRAKYHRQVTSETRNPTTNWKKADVISFLRSRKAPLPESVENFENMTLPPLRLLAKAHAIPNKYVIEEMAEKTGKDIKIVWLPVAHCELNAIELVWSFVKRKVSLNNKTFKIKDVCNLTDQIMRTQEVKYLWKKCIDHVIKLEQLIVDKEHIADECIDQARRIIIDPNVSDSESDSDSNSDQESDSDSSSTKETDSD